MNSASFLESLAATCAAIDPKFIMVSPVRMLGSDQMMTTTTTGGTFFVSFTTMMAFGVLYNVMCWYKFHNAWTLISQARHVDNSRRRRRLTAQQLETSRIHVDSMCQHMSCPICLVDFYEQDLVTPCDDSGCGNWFHRECLFRWLEESDACPCCRKDMLKKHRPEKSWFSLLGSSGTAISKSS